VVVARFLNTIFGQSEAADFFWRVQVPIGVRQLFHHVLTIGMGLCLAQLSSVIAAN
jgi:hypothetical protein